MSCGGDSCGIRTLPREMLGGGKWRLWGPIQSSVGLFVTMIQQSFLRIRVRLSRSNYEHSASLSLEPCPAVLETAPRSSAVN